MEKSKSIISWGQLFLIFGAVCLFIFALTQRVNFDPQPQKEIIPLTNFEFNSGAITKYLGTEDTIVEIPKSYGFGPTTNITGRVTFKNQSQAFNFLNDNYASGASGYKDFYQQLLQHSYPWTYDYSIDKPSFVVGDDIAVREISDSAFKNHSEIEKIIIPSSVETIGNFAFQYCSNLTEVELNEGLTFIGDSSFWGCAFKTINLPNTLKTIYPYAFFTCSKLETITIPQNVEKMTLGTFNACKNLKTVKILSDYQIQASGTTVYDVFSNCTSLQTVYVPAKHLNYYKTTYPWSNYASKYKTL